MLDDMDDNTVEGVLFIVVRAGCRQWAVRSDGENLVVPRVGRRSSGEVKAVRWIWRYIWS
jgi:hypothetical protein